VRNSGNAGQQGGYQGGGKGGQPKVMQHSSGKGGHQQQHQHHQSSPVPSPQQGARKQIQTSPSVSSSSTPPPPAAASSMIPIEFDEEKVISKLKSCISDWLTSSNVEELLLSWKEILIKYSSPGTGNKEQKENENIRHKMAKLLIEDVTNRACEAKRYDRIAMGEAILTLSRKENGCQLKPHDFIQPLTEFLEFFEDLLMDIPTLYENITELFWPWVTNNLVKLSQLETIFIKYQKGGDPPMNKKTIHNFFQSIAKTLMKMEFKPLADEAEKIQKKFV